VNHNISTSIAVGALLVASTAFAQTKAPEPDYTLSYNVGAVTEYRYRGISQSAKKPALQFGADFAHKNGAYLGAWGSTISWIKDSGTGLKGPLEMDIYGGYKGAINDSLSFDVGGLQYWYVNNNLKNAGFSNANTFELYGALSAGPATLKYSHSMTDLFGSVNSKGSGYLDASATFDLGNGFSVVPHIGRQVVKRAFAYTDYSVALNKDIDGLVLSATLVGTNIKSKYGMAYTLPGSGSKDLAGTTVVLGIKKNF
jgi:uncharacterized protein (TIGR02001 family)